MTKQELHYLKAKLKQDEYDGIDLMSAQLVIDYLIEAIERIEDILKGDDGQAYTEAEKFLELFK